MQYQFLLDDLKHSDEIQSELSEVGISADDIHFISERSADFAGHHVHEGSIIEERDLIHSGIRGAIVGLIAGVVVSVAVDLIQPYGWQPELLNKLLLTLLCVGFGGWIGGLVGISHRNYRISRLEAELQKGKAIMLVYTDEEHAIEVQQMLRHRHPDARFVGQDSHFDNPLKSAPLTELED